MLSSSLHLHYIINDISCQAFFKNFFEKIFSNNEAFKGLLGFVKDENTMSDFAKKTFIAVCPTIYDMIFKYISITQGE